MIDCSLENVGKITRSDKIHHHGYHRFYERFLEPIRSKVTDMLEIGLDQGYSVFLWRMYFKSANLYGFDIHKPAECESKVWSIRNIPKNINIQGDQSRVEDLEFLKSTIGKRVQFILDDGSHISEHQILSFNYLFDHVLEEGGVYIIEDIETSYWKRGGLYGYETRYGFEHAKSCVERFKPMIDLVNWEFLNEQDRVKLKSKLDGFSESVYGQVESINFGRNCIIITKRNSIEDNNFNRAYRFRINNP
jgi:hypothetical protein